MISVNINREREGMREKEERWGVREEIFSDRLVLGLDLLVVLSKTIARLYA